MKGVWEKKQWERALPTLWNLLGKQQKPMMERNQANGTNNLVFSHLTTMKYRDAGVDRIWEVGVSERISAN